MAYTSCSLSLQMTSQQQAELHLTTAQGLATVYELFAKVSGASMDGFEKELVRNSCLEDVSKAAGITSARVLMPRQLYSLHNAPF